jgi:sulfite reductase alpha subunit-like flavoprotein
MLPENGNESPISDITLSIQSTVHIYYCSTGTTALKLAGKLRKRVKELPGNFQIVFNILNYLDIRTIELPDLVLIVASTTGDGCFPANGADFEAAMNEMSQKYYGKSFPVRFSIFGVGDSGYPTFNAAAIKLYRFLKTVGGVPIASGLVKGNIAVEPLPLSSFNRWWGTIKCSLTGNENIIETIEDEYVEQQRMLKTFKTGKLLAKCPSETKDERIIMILLELGDVDYLEMSHLRLLPWNVSTQVSRALSALGVGGNGQLVPFTDLRLQPWTYADFFQYFVDLEGKFKNLRWLSKISSTEDLSDPNGTVIEVLECLPMLQEISDELRVEICLNMPLLRPRSFSVASSAQYIGRGRVEVMVKVHRGGRFTDIFLSATDAGAGAPVKYSLVSKIPGRDLLSSDKPLIAICTGTGFAPIRSLLQQKIHNLKQAEARDNPSQFTKFSISLFLGFKTHDQAVFNDVIFEASQYGLIDMLFLVPSNEQKKRVQEYVEDNKDGILTKIREGSIYVCGGTAMVKDIARMLSKMIGEDVRQRLGRRYVEEVF